jgi:peptidoglycan/LPS O-acetylase OafA/YrhL
MVPDVPVQKEAAGRVHLGHVDGLRALAAWVVYVNHAYGQTWLITAGQLPPPELSLFSYSLVLGHLSVSVFIVLSGFCLALPLIAHGGELRGGWKAFYRRRARRILPPYYAALGLSLLLIFTILGEPTGTLWDVPILINWQRIVSHVLLLQNLFGTGSINYVFWSIAVEWQIYILFPLLVLVWRRLGPWPTVGIALLIGYSAATGLSHTRLVRASPHYLGLFTIGMLAAHVARSDRAPYPKLLRGVPWHGVAALSGLSAVGLMVWQGFRLGHNVMLILDFLVGVFACALLVVSTRPEGGRLRAILAWKPLAAVGVFSYSIYLVHAPLLQLMWQYVFHPAGIGGSALFVWLMTAGFAVTLAISYAFHRVFEAPFMSAPAAARRPDTAPTAAA